MRLGAALPKPLLELAGQPILCWTIDAFLAVDSITAVTVLYKEDYRREFEQALSHYPKDRVWLTPGGVDRQSSVRCGLEHLGRVSDLSSEPFVLVHDAARCLIKPELVLSVSAALKHKRAVTAAVPVTDTIKQSTADGYKTLDRGSLHAIQTPQGFRLSELLEAHRSVEGLFTDDSSLFESFVAPVSLIDGERSNIKVTTPSDLVAAEAFLRSRLLNN